MFLDATEVCICRSYANDHTQFEWFLKSVWSVWESYYENILHVHEKLILNLKLKGGKIKRNLILNIPCSPETL